MIWNRTPREIHIYVNLHVELEIGSVFVAFRAVFFVYIVIDAHQPQARGKIQMNHWCAADARSFNNILYIFIWIEPIKWKDKSFNGFFYRFLWSNFSIQI